MAIPEGYTELGRIGFVDKGNYSATTTYRIGDVVYYNGSTWSALKDNLKGVTPVNGANWRYMARGFAAELLADVTAKDTSGVLGTAGASVASQALVDAIADRVMTKLLAKTNVTNNLLTTEAGYALDARQGKALKTLIDNTNSDLEFTRADLTIPNWVTGNGVNAVYKFGKVGMLSLRVQFNSSVATGTTDYILASFPSNIKPNRWITTSAVTTKGITVQLLCDPAQTQVKMNYNVAAIQAGDEIIVQIPVIFG